MAFITLTSDYGHSSHYVAAIKGLLYKQIQNVHVIDITHTITPHDVLQTAYILKHASPNFPENTIHIISIDTSYAKYHQFLIVKYKKQFFIGADNGLFSLLFDEPPENIFAINSDLINPDDLFPDKNLFVNIAAKIIDGEDLNLFSSKTIIRNIKQNISPVVEENLIRGCIIFIDGYGNAITNISKELFESKNFEKSRFAIFYRRKDKITYISKNYSDVKNGAELALFNESEQLEIAMNNGTAGQLLGLKNGGQIIIEFYD